MMHYAYRSQDCIRDLSTLLLDIETPGTRPGLFSSHGATFARRSHFLEGWFDVRDLGAVLGYDSYAGSSSRICGLSCRGRSFRQPSPKNCPSSTIATTASLPCRHDGDLRATLLNEEDCIRDLSLNEDALIFLIICRGSSSSIFCEQLMNIIVVGRRGRLRFPHDASL